MSNTKIIAIAAIAIIVIAAAAFVLMNNGGSDDKDKDKDKDPSDIIDIDDTLGMVYGNANGDFYLDSADLAIIDKIISGDLKKSDYPLADANRDGNVNLTDYEIVNKYINGQSTTIIVKDTTGHNVSVKYPIDNLFTAGGTNMRVLIGVLDLEEFMVANATNDYISPVLDKTLYDLKANGTIKTCTTSATAADFATLSPLPFSLAILEKSGFTGYISDNGLKFFDEKKVDYLEFSVDNFDDLKRVVATVGILFHKEAKAEKFVDLMDGVVDTIKKATGEKYGTATVMDIVMSNSLSGTQSDYYYATILAGGKNLADWEDATRPFSKGDTWLYEPKYNPDYLFHFKSMRYGDAPSVTEISSYVTNFDETKAYKNDRYYLMNGTSPLPVRIAYMGGIMYSEYLAEDWYLDVFQEYFDEFVEYPGWNVKEYKITWDTEDLRELLK